MSQKGYCVVPELYEELCQELEKLQIPYRTVTRPEGFGEPIRPVLISSEVAPRRWTRYRKCKSGLHGMGLNYKGLVSEYCRFCPDLWQPTVESSWEDIELRTPVRELELPSWIDQLDVLTVDDVRSKLKRNELHSVGPERAVIVTAALAMWRNKTLETLTHSKAEEASPGTQDISKETLALLKQGV